MELSLTTELNLEFLRVDLLVHLAAFKNLQKEGKDNFLGKIYIPPSYRRGIYRVVSPQALDRSILGLFHGISYIGIQIVSWSVELNKRKLSFGIEELFIEQEHEMLPVVQYPWL